MSHPAHRHEKDALDAALTATAAVVLIKANFSPAVARELAEAVKWQMGHPAWRKNEVALRELIAGIEADVELIQLGRAAKAGEAA